MASLIFRNAARSLLNATTKAPHESLIIHKSFSKIVNLVIYYLIYLFFFLEIDFLF